MRALPECIRIDVSLQNLHSRSMVFAVKESQNFRGVVWDLSALEGTTPQRGDPPGTIEPLEVAPHGAPDRAEGQGISITSTK